MKLLWTLAAALILLLPLVARLNAWRLRAMEEENK